MAWLLYHFYHYSGLYDGHCTITLLWSYLEQQLIVVIGLALESIPSVIIGVIRENCFLWSSFHIKNTHSLCRFSYVCLPFNYVRLSFNYYVSSCLLDVQLGSILSFNYYFLSLNYPWSFSHLIITVCHLISYLMNFIELWLVAIQLFNIVSISIDRLYLSQQKHRWLLTDVFARAPLRLSCTRFENGVNGNSTCERFWPKRRKLSTSINIVEWSGGYPEVNMHVFLPFN